MSPETKSKKLDKRLYTDELTRIHNRRYLKDVIPGELAKAEEEENTVAIFMIDMDKFKGINDTYGHAVGDEALKHFSKVLTLECKDNNGVAIRYAGDEFVLVMHNLDKKEARSIGLAILEKLKESPLKVKDKDLILGCSLGVSLFPKDGKTLKMLFEKADEALYMAKNRGRGTVVVYPDSGKLLVPTKLDSILDTPEIVGRNEIIQFIDTHLSDKGNPSVFPVLLGGEGTGKSRLMEYARGRAQKKLAFALFTKGYPLWQSEMYGAVFSALVRLFEQESSISNRVFSELEDKYKLILKPQLHPWDTKEAKSAEESPEPDSSTIFEALTQTFFILREIGDGAVLLDDADLVDQPSLEFFDSQYTQKEGGKLFFVCSINSPDILVGEEKLLSLFESMPEMIIGSEVRRFQLESLSLEDIRKLTEKLFDGKTLAEETEKSLLNKSSGNPLFIIEAISFLLLNGKIEAVGDEWDLSLAKPDDVPSNLSEMLKKRLMSMDKEAVNVLKLASILGEKINTHQLAEMSELKEQQVSDILINARRALLIEESPNPDEFVFTHRLDRSVFYSLMSEEERRHYHSLAADIEQKLAPGALERVVGKLAYHFQSAGQLEQASKMFSTLRSQLSSVSISKGARKLLQRKTLTSSMAKEAELNEEDLASAVDLGRAFRAILHNFRLYPKEHENVKNSIARFMELLEPFLEEKTEILTLSLTKEKTLFNGQPPPPTRDDPRLTADLYEALNNFGLQGVLFLKGIHQDEVMRFLEAFTRHPENVAGQWDVLVDELELSHILPDRKMFVAVGEHKVILDDQELLARAPNGEREATPMPTGQDAGPAMSDEQIEQLRSILEQFAKEKQELLDAIKSEGIGTTEFQQLVSLLQHTDIAEAERTVRMSGEVAPQAEGAPPQEEKFAEVQPQQIVVDWDEKDLYPAFEDLNSKDTETRAKAAAWLVNQDISKLAAAGLKAIASDMPLEARRLAATVIQKAGEDAVEELLGKINPNAPGFSLLKLLTVADTFVEYPKLIPLLRKIALTGPTETVRPAIELLEQIPGKEVDMIFLEVFNLASGKVKMEILSLITKRRILEAVPLLMEIIRSKKTWEPEERVSLQEQVCRTLGQLGAAEATEALIAAAMIHKPWTLLKAKPDSIREAATLALRQLPDKMQIRKALDVLKRDKSPLVRKAARQ